MPYRPDFGVNYGQCVDPDYEVTITVRACKLHRISQADE